MTFKIGDSAAKDLMNIWSWGSKMVLKPYWFDHHVLS